MIDDDLKYIYVEERDKPSYCMDAKRKLWRLDEFLKCKQPEQDTDIDPERYTDSIWIDTKCNAICIRAYDTVGLTEEDDTKYFAVFLEPFCLQAPKETKLTFVFDVDGKLYDAGCIGNVKNNDDFRLPNYILYTIIDGQVYFDTKQEGTVPATYDNLLYYNDDPEPPF